jgi:hypothetical protein
MNDSTVWLAYGMNADGGLVSVQDVISGRTDLMCPYCHGLLTAKKGKVKSPHFAHTGETCDKVRRGTIPTLPMYDRFNLHLSGKEVEFLQTYWDLYGVHNWAGPWSDMAAKLEKKGFLQANVYRPRGWFEFTKLGKIPIGVLSLNLFSRVQEPMIMKQYDQLAYLAEKNPDDETSQADFRIYLAQLRRILAATLYFVEVQLDGSTLHKIGVTARSMDERAREITRDLAPYAPRSTPVNLKVLGTWSHRGNIELYFKHRYARRRVKQLGALTEYFAFDDLKAVLRDLKRMPLKGLTPVERQILNADTGTARQRTCVPTPAEAQR